MSNFIGLDLGTSSLKALLIDEDQNTIGSAFVTIESYRPQSGWSEQNPADWLFACDQVLSDLAAKHPNDMSAVAAIGLSGHMHGACLLDKMGEVLRPCIMWNDTRAHLEAARFDGLADFREISGNIVFPGFTAPKLAWVSKNEPAIFDRIAKILLPKDYLRYWLTGEFVSDMSDWSGTSWLDVAKREHASSLIKLGGVSKAQMPRLVEGTDPSGVLKNELAQSWRMPKGVIIAGGAGDNAAAACGLGVVKAGQGFVSLGTSGVIFAATEVYRPKPESAVHTFCHALPNTWHQMGVILSATDSLNWLAKLVSQPVDELVAALEIKQGPSDLQFLPYLSGERTPHNLSVASGAFIGLSHQHDSKDLTHAVLQGVSFALKQNVEILRQTGTQFDSLLATGGGAKSATWLSMLATILEIPIDVPEDSNLGAANGAARLAMAAKGMENVFEPPQIAMRFEPNSELSDGYNDSYNRFKQLGKLLL